MTNYINDMIQVRSEIRYNVNCFENELRMDGIVKLMNSNRFTVNFLFNYLFKECLFANDQNVYDSKNINYPKHKVTKYIEYLSKYLEISGPCFYDIRLYID